MNKALQPNIEAIPLYRDEPVPIVLVSGFLGAGKTTFIRQYLAQGAAQDTAVIVNEFGEIGLDHLILETVADDIVLMENGCLCCASSGDLEQTLISLYERRENSELPSYSRVIIETSGIASPESILSQLNADNMRLSPYRYQGMINILDAETFLDSYKESREARMQVLFSDQVLINKSEGLPASRIEKIQSVLVEQTGDRGDFLQVRQMENGGNVVGDYIERLQRSSRSQRSSNQSVNSNLPAKSHHPDAVFSASRRTERFVSPEELMVFVDELLHKFSDDLLRLKILMPNPQGSGQLFLQTVRNRWFPRQLVCMGDEDVPKHTSLVVIAKQAAEAQIVPDLEAFFSY